MSWVLDHVRGVKPAERLVLLSLANHASATGDDSWPSRATIAAEADLSLDTVDRALAALKKLGIVECHVQDGGDRRTPPSRRPNRYRLRMDLGHVVVDGHRVHGGNRLPQHPPPIVETPPATCPPHPSRNMPPPPLPHVAGPNRPSEPSLEPSLFASAVADAAEEDATVIALPVAKAAKHREPDPLWDAVVEVCGPAATKAEQKRRGMVCSQLRAAGASPDDVYRAAAAARQMWRNITLTDTALVNRFSMLLTEANRRRLVVDPTRPAATQPAAIGGWTPTERYY